MRINEELNQNSQTHEYAIFRIGLTHEDVRYIQSKATAADRQVFGRYQQTGKLSDLVAALAIFAAILEERSSPAASSVVTKLSGEFCRDCGSPNMLRTGTCMTCQDCGSSLGCA